MDNFFIHEYISALPLSGTRPPADKGEEGFVHGRSYFAAIKKSQIIFEISSRGGKQGKKRKQKEWEEALRIDPQNESAKTYLKLCAK